jgi:hypothetical protein
MATNIRLTRKTRAPKMPVLQQDDGLWDVAQEVETFLLDHELHRVTADDIAEHLTPLHQTVSVTTEPGYYWYYWDYESAIWIRVCESPSTVSVRDAVDEDPILVLVEESARYV